MKPDYSSRKIWSVKVHGVAPVDVGGSQGVSTAVTVWLAGKDNENQPGPKIDLHFAFPASKELSLQELQDEALACVSALLHRASQETTESLRAAAKKVRKLPSLPDET